MHACTCMLSNTGVLLRLHVVAKELRFGNWCLPCTLMPTAALPKPDWYVTILYSFKPKRRSCSCLSECAQNYAWDPENSPSVTSVGVCSSFVCFFSSPHLWSCIRRQLVTFGLQSQPHNQECYSISPQRASVKARRCIYFNAGIFVPLRLFLVFLALEWVWRTLCIIYTISHHTFASHTLFFQHLMTKVELKWTITHDNINDSLSALK